MANDKAQNTSAPQETDAGNEVHERIHNSQNPAFEGQGTRDDISNVDQQEGDMNNGETGANLTPNDENK